MGLTTADFRQALEDRLKEAGAAGVDHLDIKAGDLHRALGGYPGRSHHMPACCNAMRAAMRARDQVLSEPPKGRGASLVIRYRLPRG